MIGGILRRIAFMEVNPGWSIDLGVQVSPTDRWKCTCPGDWRAGTLGEGLQSYEVVSCEKQNLLVLYVSLQSLNL